MRLSPAPMRSRTRGARTATGPRPVMIARSVRWPWRTSRWRPSSVCLSAWPLRKAATSASTACANRARAPSRRTSVSGSEKAAGWISLTTLLSWVTACHSFGGEVEARTPPRYAASTPHAVTNFRAYLHGSPASFSLTFVQCSIKLCSAASSVAYRCCSPPWAFPPRPGPPFGVAPFLEGRSMFQLERWLMLPASLTPVAQLSCEALRLGCEAYSLIGLRLFKMVTGGVPAVSEALRMVPEKITALIDAQILVAASVLSGRPDLALGRVVALYRDRVSDNEQRLTA